MTVLLRSRHSWGSDFRLGKGGLRMKWNMCVGSGHNFGHAIMGRLG